MSTRQGASSRPSTRRKTLVPLKKPCVASRCAPRTERSHAYTSQVTVSRRARAGSGPACQVCLSSLRSVTGVAPALATMRTILRANSRIM
jgi:hypothetical protein